MMTKNAAYVYVCVKYKDDGHNMSIQRISGVSIRKIGHGLHRPECVLGTPSGDVFVPDWRGGVSVVRHDGTIHTWLARNISFELRPNGIAFTPEGFLLANLSDVGGVWTLRLDGELTPFLTEIEGAPLPPANFVFVDESGRVWISISTRHIPRQQAWRKDVADGFILVVDRAGARIVADGLHYTNEVRVDPSGRWLYVVETFGRRLSRYAIHADASLDTKQVVVTFDDGFFPDGFAFDEAGGIWVTSIVSNRIVRITSGGRVDTVISETNENYLADVNAAFNVGKMESGHLGRIPQSSFQHLTCITFGGADRRTAYLGSLHEDCIYGFYTHIAGAKPPYWDQKLP